MKNLIIRTYFSITFFIFLLAISPGLHGAYPMWRYNANRSASSSEGPTSELKLQWKRNLGKPSPAYYHQMRMCADVTYAPVSDNGLLFVPSNSTDAVTAYDLDTGEEIWSFITGGPVRYAPVVWKDNIYFGSDDGYLYCVSALNGKLHWKIRGAPENFSDRRLLLNGRIGSRWPVRGGPVLYDGIIYFGAGIWPEEKVYVVAVDAKIGEVIWRNDRMSLIDNGMNDHMIPYPIGLPPQGYLAVIDDKLLVPSGRALAAFFDLKTGEMEPYTTFYAKFHPPRGYWYISGINHYWFQGGNIMGTRTDVVKNLPPNQMPLVDFAEFAGIQINKIKDILLKTNELLGGYEAHIHTQTRLIQKNGKEIVELNFDNPYSAGICIPGRNRTKPNETWVAENHPLLRVDPVHLSNSYRETGVFSEPIWTESTIYWSEFSDPERHSIPRGHTRVKYPEYDWIVARDITNPHWGVNLQVGQVMRELEFPVKWKLKAPYKVLMKAGSRLYGAVRDTIAAIAIPEGGGKPRIAWKSYVDGVPVNVLVSDNKLLVVTNTGHLYCFGEGKESVKSFPQKKSVIPEGKKRLQKMISKILPLRPDSGGYALVLGWGKGEIARELTHQSSMKIIVLEGDEHQVKVAQRELMEEGLYGRRIQVINGTPGNLNITPYWADLVMFEGNEFLLNSDPESTLRVVSQVLRPYTGVALLPSNWYNKEELNDFFPENIGYQIIRYENLTKILRTSPLPGSDDWTHEAGNPANTFSNRDRLVKPPFKLLWFSGSSDRAIWPEYEFQHARNPMPLVKEGRMFIMTSNALHSMDIYTGRYLWRANLPEARKLLELEFNHRPFSRTQDNFLAVRDKSIYVISNQDCLVFKNTTGEKLKTLNIPKKIREFESSPQWYEFRLSKNRLLAVFGRTLACMNSETGEVLWEHISSLENSTFAVGNNNVYCVDYEVPPRLGDVKTKRSAVLKALDLTSGKEKWNQELTIPTLPKQEKWGIAEELTLAPLKPLVTYNKEHDILLTILNRKYLTAYQAKDGKRIWSRELECKRKERLHLMEPPTILSDYVIPHQFDYAQYGGVFDIQTGESVNLGNIVPSKRGCSRIVGNNYVVTYRDAATAIYDLNGQEQLRNNAVRSGCTNGMVPANSILNAPGLAHGCTCNYPLFSSYALFPVQETDKN